MSMIQCDCKECIYNVDFECMEVARNRINISAARSCRNYTRNIGFDLEKVKTRVSKLLANSEKQLLSSEDPETRTLCQGNVNALEVVLSIIRDVEGRK